MGKRLVLVTGATGNQGGAVARALIENGHSVRALVRKEGGKADSLKSIGAELAVGNYDDPDSLERAASGVDAVFAVATPFAGGLETEIRHGKNLAEAAAKAGVAHLVYSSVASADRQTGIPHFDSKYEVEKHIRTLDVPWTVVAPVYFFDNVLLPFNIADIKQGRFRQSLAPDKKLQEISVRDIGRFNALVIERRKPFLEKRIDIAGDELTGPDIAAALSEASGRPIDYEEQDISEMRAMSEDMALMYEWFVRVGYSVDIGALRSKYPEVGWLSFEQWANEQDWDAILAD